MHYHLITRTFNKILHLQSCNLNINTQHRVGTVHASWSHRWLRPTCFPFRCQLELEIGLDTYLKPLLLWKEIHVQITFQKWLAVIGMPILCALHLVERLRTSSSPTLLAPPLCPVPPWEAASHWGTCACLLSSPTAVSIVSEDGRTMASSRSGGDTAAFWECMFIFLPSLTGILYRKIVPQLRTKQLPYVGSEAPLTSMDKFDRLCCLSNSACQVQFAMAENQSNPLWMHVML